MASIKKIEGKGGVSYKITVSMGRDMKDKQLRQYAGKPVLSIGRTRWSMVHQRNRHRFTERGGQ